ncbi:hypothetical protein UFOVP223_79 [uncultured Caudovirales phage]|uniref:Uncharacterized protein n=1 Tax=uncultured Caudovirales phage TaxID=2100421 RepID=A0A6J5L7R7_9CAUD|nr:hypothetical protein UFOVP110_85 [uncultured Caudovirales phage]CAB5219464.1 hypothetical protein UFOVP223_79 [uncultured Caudovirales phage]
MAEVPTNEKLYAMVVTQAKAKYRIYPSPGASHWVHRRYLEMGGKFVDSEKLAEQKRAIQHYREAKAKLHEKKSKDSDEKKNKDK